MRHCCEIISNAFKIYSADCYPPQEAKERVLEAIDTVFWWSESEREGSDREEEIFQFIVRTGFRRELIRQVFDIPHITDRFKLEFHKVLDAEVERAYLQHRGERKALLTAAEARNVDQNVEEQTSTPPRKLSVKTAQNQKRRGRPQDNHVAFHRRQLLPFIKEGLTGKEYVKRLTDGRVPTPTSWQSEGCPKTYLEAYNHKDPEQRKKWRNRIADEKYKTSRDNQHAKIRY